MKRLLLLLTFLFVCSLAHAQCHGGLLIGSVGPYPLCAPNIGSASGAPGGSCPSAGATYVDTTTPGFYYCPTAGGSWTLVSVGGSLSVASGAYTTCYNAGDTYPTCTTAVTSRSITAVTHNQGVNAMAVCYDNSSPRNQVPCGLPTSDASGNLTFTWTPAANGSITVYSGNIGGGATATVGGAVASAASITPTAEIFHVTGTTTITTITVVAGFTGCKTLIPDAIWATGTSGNIALASTAVVSRALRMCYDGTKWYPSY